MNKFVGNSKEKFLYHNTLLCLVKALQDQNITVDLRNDTYVCGYLQSVDGFMNLSFQNVVYVDPQGNEYLFENLFVHGRNIRYVHVPEVVAAVNIANRNIVSSLLREVLYYGQVGLSRQMSILATIRNEFRKKQSSPPPKPAQKSRKAKKALKQHLETVASLKPSTSAQ